MSNLENNMNADANFSESVENKGNKKEGKGKKLIAQILKFGVVGGLSFVIDFVVYTIVVKILPFEKGYLIAGICGFTISLIFNYLASMAFVFERKDNVDKRKEFLIFLGLSLIGMGLNTLLLWLYVDLICANAAAIYNIHAAVHSWLISININFFNSTKEFIEICAKVFATAIVMVYNFISRKMILEKKN